VRHLTAGSAQANPLLPQAELQVEPQDAYRAGLRVMDELYSQAASDSTLNLHRARFIVNSLIDILTKDRFSLMNAALIKNYDANTAHHSVNVGILSLFMASRLAFDRDLTATLGLAALLHDIGKVRIPLEILTKAGKLTDHERQVMQLHPVYGAQMLRSLAGLSRLAMVVAFEHHANYDLSGYPQIVTKTRPHLLARVVQIVDVFDAATTPRRMYRQAQTADDAMRFIIAGTGTLYDPALTRIFTHEMGVYPVGTLVQLDGGDLAVVRQPGRHDPTRPLLSVIDPRASPPEVLFDLNLEENRDRSIVRSVSPTEANVDLAAVQLPLLSGSREH
jgi:putative nucleotidyltransferase with HDIG domain